MSKRILPEINAGSTEPGPTLLYRDTRSGDVLLTRNAGRPGAVLGRRQTANNRQRRRRHKGYR